MSDATRERVREAALSMGYPFERLRSRHPQLQRVAVLCPAGRHALYYETALEVIRLLGQQGASVLVSMEYDSLHACAAVTDSYRQRSIDAAVLVGSRVSEDELPDSSVPYVLIGEAPDSVHLWRVGVDNRGGGRAIGEHLWGLGHRCVGWVGVTSSPIINGQRLGGLRDVWESRGEPLPDDWVLSLEGDEEGSLPSLLPGWLEGARRAGHELTALSFYNDIHAAIGLTTLHRMGLRVPDDVSVTGFDDAAFAVWLNPALTTVGQPFSQMGALAAQLLQEQAAVPNLPPREHVLVCQLVPRESTAAPGALRCTSMAVARQSGQEEAAFV